MSLWPADDRSTTFLMKRFHAALATPGATDQEALASAQKAVRTFEDDDGSRPWVHPYYWAGWVFWGRAD